MMIQYLLLTQTPKLAVTARLLFRIHSLMIFVFLSMPAQEVLTLLTHSLIITVKYTQSPPRWSSQASSEYLPDLKSRSLFIISCHFNALQMCKTTVNCSFYKVLQIG